MHIFIQLNLVMSQLGAFHSFHSEICCELMLQLLFNIWLFFFLPVCTEYLETSSRSNAELSIRQHRKPQSQRHPHESEKDCTIAKRVCQEDLYCSSVYRSFQRACRAEAAKCRMGSQECLSAWKELRKTVLGECKCSEPLQRRCLRIWKGIFISVFGSTWPPEELPEEFK